MFQKLHVRFLISPTFVAWLMIALCGTILFDRFMMPHFPGKTPPHLLHAPGYPIPVDFGVYLIARERVRARETPYVQADSSPFKYAPGVLALFDTLPDRPEPAWFSFGTLSVLALVAGLFAGASYKSWRSVGLLALGMVFAWKGILETLAYGQLELVIFGIAVLAAAILRRSPLLAGFLAGILPWFKMPWLFLFLPLLLALAGQVMPFFHFPNDKKPSGIAGQDSQDGQGAESSKSATPAKTAPKRARRVSGLVFGYVISLFVWGAAVPSVIFGSDRALKLSQEWLKLLKAQPDSLFLSDMNQSLWIFLHRIVSWLDLGSAHALVVLSIGFLLTGLLVARLMMRSQILILKQQGALAWIGPWLLLTQLLNPLSWRWGSVFALGLPLAIGQFPSVLEAGRVRRALWIGLWGLAVILWLGQQTPVVQVFGVGHWTQLHAYGSISAFWLTLLLLCV